MDSAVIDRVKLEVLSPGHAQELYDLTDANREYLREWLPWLDGTKNISDTNNFITSTTASGAAPTFAVLHDGHICGIAGFNEINTQHRIGYLGYWLAQEYVGNGIITTAVEALIKMGFNDHKLNKIEVHCAENNLKSRAIPERLGFTHEATLKDREWLYNRYVNHVIYSMLQSEYNE